MPRKNFLYLITAVLLTAPPAAAQVDYLAWTDEKPQWRIGLQMANVKAAVSGTSADLTGNAVTEEFAMKDSLMTSLSVGYAWKNWLVVGLSYGKGSQRKI